MSEIRRAVPKRKVHCRLCAEKWSSRRHVGKSFYGERVSEFYTRHIAQHGLMEPQHLKGDPLDDWRCQYFDDSKWEVRAMQANLLIRCAACSKKLGVVRIDTADMPDQLQAKINLVILRHRQDCKYYRGEEKSC